jgi:hypothetical protein
MVPRGIGIEVVPWRPIFQKCPHLREKGGVLTEIRRIRNRLSRTVPIGTVVKVTVYIPFDHWGTILAVPDSYI